MHSGGRMQSSGVFKRLFVVAETHSFLRGWTSFPAAIVFKVLRPVTSGLLCVLAVSD
jgi:hypothetical protein